MCFTLHTLPSIMPHHAAPHNTTQHTQHHAVLRSTTQHHAAPRSITQHHAAQRSITHHAARSITQHHYTPTSPHFTLLTLFYYIVHYSATDLLPQNLLIYFFFSFVERDPLNRLTREASSTILSIYQGQREGKMYPTTIFSLSLLPLIFPCALSPFPLPLPIHSLTPSSYFFLFGLY